MYLTVIAICINDGKLTLPDPVFSKTIHLDNKLPWYERWYTIDRYI